MAPLDVTSSAPVSRWTSESPISPSEMMISNRGSVSLRPRGLPPTGAAGVRGEDRVGGHFVSPVLGAAPAVARAAALASVAPTRRCWAVAPMRLASS